ncbi:MAG: DUF2357 domain-containing protein [Bacteroidota bacterium]
MRGLNQSQDGQTLHGTLNTRAHIGQLRLEIAVNERPVLVLKALIAPTKVDPDTVTHMRDEVEGHVAGLSLRYLRATSSNATPTPHAEASGGGWLRLVESALDEMDWALRHIARAPVETIVRRPTSTRADAIRRPDAFVRRARRRGATGRTQRDDRIENRRKPPDDVQDDPWLRTRRLPAARACASLDTPEHRWLRSSLSQARSALQTLHRAESMARPHARKQVHLDALSEALVRTRALLQLSPLDAALPGPLPAPTLRLRRMRHYRDAYEAARLLRLGLALGSGRLRVSLVDLAQLYEHWCFVTLAAALQRYLGAPHHGAGLAAADASGLRLRLRQGTAHALQFGEKQGVRVLLAYQPRFGHPALLPQRPDMLLTIEQPGHVPRRIVLDAKYRRDDSAAALRRYGQPAPPPDALADLHRYRDAIRDAKGERMIDQALALYPYATGKSEGERARLRQSIEDLGVGALPLLPQTKQHLDAWLRQVLQV